MSLFLIISVVVTSCRDSPEALVDDTIDVFAEMTEILEEYAESGDSEEAIAELKGLEDEVADVKERMTDLLKSEFDDKKSDFNKKMREIFEDKEGAQEAMEKFYKLRSKLRESGKEGAEELFKALEELGKGLK